MKRIEVQSYRDYVNAIVKYGESKELLENFIKDGKYIIYIK